MLCNGTEDWWSFLLRQIVMPLLSLIPGTPSISQLSTSYEKKGYRAADGGFFLKRYRGGGKLAQIHVSCNGGSPILSDTLLQHGKTALTLLILHSRYSDETEPIQNILKTYGIPPSILSETSIVQISERRPGTKYDGISSLYHLCSKSGAVDKDSLGKNVPAYFGRFGTGARYVLVRPDLIIFSVSRALPELETCLGLLKEKN
jgi:hypothetical protein